MLLKGARDRANKYGLDFSLVKEDIKIPTHCPVLGIPLFRNRKPFADNSPSLDRINSVKGYTKGNICVISNRANLLKKDATLDELRKLVKYLETHQDAF